MKRKGISVFEGGIFDTIALILIILTLFVGIILIVTISQGGEGEMSLRLVDLGNWFINKSIVTLPS